MKAFFREGKDRGAGLSDKLCFTLVKRLLAHNERRSHGAEDSQRVLASVAIHRLRAAGSDGYALVVRDSAVLDNATGPEWDSLLEQCGATSRSSLPTAFESEPFCTGAELYRMVSPMPGDGGEVYHVMLEARQDRFDALIEEAMQVEGARAAVVTLRAEAEASGKEPRRMTCVLVEFGAGGHPGGSLESLFPSAEVIRISDNTQRLVFTHLGSTCRWMFSPGNEVVLMPVLTREDSGQSKALVTFRGPKDNLELALCSWGREDESGFGSFIKFSLNTSAEPLMGKAVSELLSEGQATMPVMLTRETRAHQDERRLYVMNDASPSFPKFLARIVDAAEFSGQGAVSFARWRDPASGGIVYGFQSPAISDFESYRDVRSYRVVEARMGARGLAVREGSRFIPEMPEDEGWLAALTDTLFDSVGAGEKSWALVDPGESSDLGFSAISSLIVPEFTPFEGYRKHLEVFGPVLRASLIADEKERHADLSAQAEASWNQAAEAERANSDNQARQLFDELADKAAKLDRELTAMRDEVVATTQMAEPIHAEAKVARQELQAVASGLAAAVRSAADRSANWIQLQKYLNQQAQLLEACVRMLDEGIRVIAAAELERIRSSHVEMSARLDALRQAEAGLAEAHARSSELVAMLDSQAVKLAVEVDRRERAIMDNAAEVAEFDALAARVGSLAAIERAKALEVMKLRHAEAQCAIREQAIRSEMEKLERMGAKVDARRQRIRSDSDELERRRAAVQAVVAQVREATKDRDGLKLALGQEEQRLAAMIKGGDPRLEAQQLIRKAKDLRDQIEEVEEGRRLLVDGASHLKDLESRLISTLDGVSMVKLRSDVAGTQKDIQVLEKAILALEDVLAADDQTRDSHAPGGRAELMAAFRREAERCLKQARVAYLRSQGQPNAAFTDEVRTAIEALRKLLVP